MLLHMKDQVRSDDIKPFGMTSSLINAMIMVRTVRENSPKSASLCLSGILMFHSIMIGIDSTVLVSKSQKQLSRAHTQAVSNDVKRGVHTSGGSLLI